MALLSLGTLILIGVFAPGAQASSVSGVSVTNTSPSNAAGARTVYSVTFTTSATGGLSSSGTITITFPSGTGLGTVVGSSVLNSANTDVGSCTTSGLTATCGLFGGDSIAASSTVTVQLDGVTNPAATIGTQDALQVETSADTTAASGSFTVVGGNPITKLSAVNSSPSNAAGARTVYSIVFDTSGTGGLSALANSQIMITFPSGTNIATVVGSSVLNSANTDVGSCTTSGLTATCGLFGGDSIAAGSAVTVQLDGVTNPSVNPTGGQWTLSAQTTSDTAAQSANFTVVSGNSITKLSASISSPSNAAGARTVYSIAFTTSGTGGLSALANSQIMITFPSGTNLATVVGSSVLNSANTDVGSCTTSGLTATCGLFGGDSIAAGSAVTVQLDGVTNPSAGSQTLTAQTTSDTSPVTSSSYSVVANNLISQPTATITSPSNAAGARTVYSIAFTTSSTGGLSALANSQITITFPSGTNLATVVGSSVLNSANTDVGSCTTSGLTATCGLFGGDSIAAGSAVTVQLDGVTNPSLGSQTLTARTTSDTSPITSSPYSVVAANQITQPNVTLSNAASGATGVNYAIAFTTSSTGGLSALANSQITITFPSGTNLATVVGSSVLNSANSDVGSCTTSGLTATCGLFGGDTIGANSAVTVQLDSVTNPSTTEMTTLNVATTSDPSSVSSSPYGIGSGPTVTGVSPSSGPTAGGTSVTITGTNLTGATAVKFGSNAATNVSVVSATTLTATSPAGSAGTVDVTVTTPGGTSATSAADHYTYVTAAPTVTAVSPSSGTTGGGTSVTITGTNLTGATAVKFGSNAATNVSVVSATTLTATSPAGSAGTVDVTVTTPGGTSATSATDQFTYVSTGTAPPGVAPGPPTVQGSTGAAFSGSVNPNGLATTANFEYGIDLSDRGPGSSTVLYDQTTTVQQVGSDSSSHSISAPVTELVPNALYHVRLVATNGAGTTNGPDQTFTMPASAPPPPPVLGKAVDVAPVSGVVFIKPPPGKTLAGDPTASAAKLGKGQGFVPLTEARQIPSGSQIDALRGSLKIVTATGQVGKTQNATIAGGVFALTQARTGITKGVTNFALQEGAFPGAPSYATCKAKGNGKKAADQATSASLSSKTLQLLKASAHGKFKTTGRYSSATVRGTIWTIADRCDGTLTHAIRDTVLVDDFVRHKTILLHAGHSYLARAIASRK